MENRRNQALLILITVLESVIILLWSFMNFMGITLHTTIVSWIFELITLAAVMIYAKYYHLTAEDLGLKLTNRKKTLTESLTIAAIFILLGIILKLVLLKVRPDMIAADAPFFRWKSRNLLGYFYVVSCTLQEFIARGFLQSGLDRIFEGKYKLLKVLGFSALIFSMYHIHLGFTFMVGAAILVSVLGILYERHGNIWGVTIVHYLIGYTYIHLFIPA